MKRDRAFELATAIAELIFKGARAVGGRTVGEQALMATLSVSHATHTRSVEAMNPAIDEVLLFGSTARGAVEPGDLDLIVLDHGFYSNLLCPREGQDDLYQALDQNLYILCEGWFGYNANEHQEYGEIVDGLATEATKVDLHVLPLAIFTDPVQRRQIAAMHKDPQFFQKAFSRLQRYDRETRAFVPVDLSYFAEKYRCELGDLTT